MKTKKIIWILFIIILGTGIFWWTTIKKQVVKQAVTHAVQKKTDSLYRITYDTSEIDEVNGNASFYHVKIQLDSLQWLKLVEKDSMPPVTLSLAIDKITIRGLGEIKLLRNRALNVSQVIFDHPVFRLDRWTRKTPPKEPLNDTLEIYKRLTGQLDFLKAASIQVTDGDFTMINRQGKDSVMVKGINITIDDFLVDSQHNYRNIISYFIAQTKASATSFSSGKVTTGKIVYDSKQHTAGVENLLVKEKENPLTVQSISLTGFSAETFIRQGAITAGKLLINQPDFTIRPAASKTKGLPVFFSAAAIDSVVIRKGNFTIYNTAARPILVRDANLLLKKVHTEGNVLQVEAFVSPATCSFSAGWIQCPMGFHNIVFQQVTYPFHGENISINRGEIRSTISREELRTKMGMQEDMYKVTATGIILGKISLEKLVKDNTLSIASLSMQLDLNVYNDKTLPGDPVKNAVEEYPSEKLQSLSLAIDIRSVTLTNSRISYEEHASKSGLNGMVYFGNVNAKLSNITNIPALMAKDNILKVETISNIMSVSSLRTSWDIPLRRQNGNFRITGSANPFPLTVLSPVFEPLGMITVRSGFADKLDFVINGNHQGSTGTEQFNYHGLKIDMLRATKQDSLQKNGIKSIIVNNDIRDNNRKQEPKEYHFKKEGNHSMFFLIWKSIFEGIRQTVLILK